MVLKFNVVRDVSYIFSPLVKMWSWG